MSMDLFWWPDVTKEPVSSHVLREEMSLAAASAAMFLDMTRVAVALQKYLSGRRPRGSVLPLWKNREKQGDGYHLLAELRFKEAEFISYCRLNFDRFEYLLGLCAPFITKKKTKTTIPPDQRLAMTLRHLASGDCVKSISYAYRCGVTTCRVIIHETVAAIIHVLQRSTIREPKCEREWKEVARRFYEKWNLPNCLGAIDGRHMVLQCPQASGSQFRNYKKTYSIVLMAVADADYSFLAVDVGGEGSANDAAILNSSKFWRKVEAKKMHIPDPVCLPNSDTVMPYFFVGDNIFKLDRHLMKPYSKRGLSPEAAILNYRLSRARRIVENAFGILVARWRIFKAPLCTKVTSAENIVMATVALHNFIMKTADPVLAEGYVPPAYVDFENPDGSVSPGAWRDMIVLEDGSLQPIRAFPRRAPKTAREQRDKLRDYLNTDGAVEWQQRSVANGFWGATLAEMAAEAETEAEAEGALDDPMFIGGETDGDYDGDDDDAGDGRLGDWLNM